MAAGPSLNRMAASNANLDISAIQSSFFAGGEFPIDQYSNTTIEQPPPSSRAPGSTMHGIV
ncbi:hypothetical protein PCANC_05909 [Puccinia coronata f. sp. avenae]|uniref:Uncharacterized protein n=1 Tax=Puccinia coronata f. sp. avenae TaxID=200324 RepID=A0A2N5VY37_9BASI|nr:hypothetical protein PCASD_16317 [Puccinia coronata f. sp. avenae]PLW54896.1 hypothetical protein PCANC_05909 [Puccinia coronata f. sp. avenae]